MENSSSIKKLLQLMERLREPEYGCPWDLQQSYRTIAPSTIEEAYEVVDAIEREDFDDLKEELGDFLFQVVFYCQLAREENRFGFDDVADAIVAKLLRRHPHVFPDGTLESRSEKPLTSDDEIKVSGQWEAIKKQERQTKGRSGVLDDIPATMPAATRAVKLQKRASHYGFDWQNTEQILAKLEEEVGEYQEASNSGNQSEVEDELGDILFTVVNLCRKAGVEPEKALRRSNSKFTDRFNFIEMTLSEQGRSLEEASLEEMDKLWELAKL